MSHCGRGWPRRFLGTTGPPVGCARRVLTRASSQCWRSACPHDAGCAAVPELCAAAPVVAIGSEPSPIVLTGRFSRAAAHVFEVRARCVSLCTRGAGRCPVAQRCCGCLLIHALLHYVHGPLCLLDSEASLLRRLLRSRCAATHVSGPRVCSGALPASRRHTTCASTTHCLPTGSPSQRQRATPRTGTRSSLSRRPVTFARGM